MNDGKVDMNEAPYMRGWTSAERAYSSWLRAARERLGSAAALGRALEERLRKERGLAPDVDLKEHGISLELSARVIARWEKGVGDKQHPQIPSDPAMREALVAAVTDLVPEPPVQMDWLTFQDVCETFVTERLERVKLSQ